MSSTIIIKNSSTSGSVPSSLVQGEFGINVYDGKLYYGSGSGNVVKEFNTSSYSATASYVNPLTQDVYITGSLNLSGSEVITGSLAISGSGSLLSVQGDEVTISGDLIELTGSLNVTGSVIITGSLNVTGGITGSLLGTASYALQALTASHALTASSADIFTVRTALTASGLNYPTADGSNDMFLTTDGAGNLSFDWVKTLHQNIHNAETSSIVRGTPLYISGSTGDNANVYFADASATNRRPATLIAYDATLAPNATGTGIISGEIQGVDTNAYPEGTIIYLGIGGGWTSIRPTGSTNLVQALGVVTRQSNNGRGIVFNQIGNNLPNIQTGYLWVGDSGSYPVAIPTSSLSVASASFATSASFALTASYVANASSFPFTGSAIITGSLSVIGPSTVTGSLSVTSSTVAATLQGSGSTVFTINGSLGNLFQVTDTLSGSLFSVNTISGLPVIEAFSDNTVRIGQFGQRALFVSQSKVGIGKESALNGILDVSGSVTVTGSVIATSFTGSLLGTASLATSASFASTASFVNPLNQNVVITGSLTVITGSSIELQVTNTGVKIGNASTDVNTVTGSLQVAGQTRISGSFNTAVSGTILTVVGSGSTQPIFTVQGSQGELFSVTDSLTGSLFSVNDISGLPILEVFSDSTTNIGNYLAPAVYTTNKITQTNSGSFVVYSLPTASYDGAFYDYTVRSGSNARAGQIMAIWSGSSVNFTETTTTSFGSTSAINFTVIVSGSNMVLTGSSATGSWTIKTIIRSI